MYHPNIVHVSQCCCIHVCTTQRCAHFPVHSPFVVSRCVSFPIHHQEFHEQLFRRNLHYWTTTLTCHPVDAAKPDQTKPQQELMSLPLMVYHLSPRPPATSKNCFPSFLFDDKKTTNRYPITMRCVICKPQLASYNKHMLL